MTKKVFVSGCYDMLHSGHVAFFKEAAQYGNLYVGIGSDDTIFQLKGRRTIYSEQERLYMVKAIRYVTDACINTGRGMIDFEESVARFRPDIFVVNEDGSSAEKERFCQERGIAYKVLKRLPEAGLEARSTTQIRTQVACQLPYRLDLAGTWIDQPYVSRYAPGWAITISLEPTTEFAEKCGMSTSTRNAAKKIWPYYLPDYNPQMLAKMLFCFENEPNANELVSGAQDAIGICMPGLTRHYYRGAYWPEKIESCLDESILAWLEAHLCLVKMFPRAEGCSVVEGARLSTANVAALATASEGCWDAIMRKDLGAFAAYFQQSFEAQLRLFPGMMAPGVSDFIDLYRGRALAWKMSGAGGGGYLALVCEQGGAGDAGGVAAGGAAGVAAGSAAGGSGACGPGAIPGAIPLKIRRAQSL